MFAEKVKERCRGGDVPRWDLEEERLKKVKSCSGRSKNGEESLSFSVLF